MGLGRVLATAGRLLSCPRRCDLRAPPARGALQLSPGLLDSHTLPGPGQRHAPRPVPAGCSPLPQPQPAALQTGRRSCPRSAAQTWGFCSGSPHPKGEGQGPQRREQECIPGTRDRVQGPGDPISLGSTPQPHLYPQTTPAPQPQTLSLPTTPVLRVVVGRVRLHPQGLSPTAPHPHGPANMTSARGEHLHTAWFRALCLPQAGLGPECRPSPFPPYRSASQPHIRADP